MDRADNTARLALELAQVRRELAAEREAHAALRAALAEQGPTEGRA